MMLGVFFGFGDSKGFGRHEQRKDCSRKVRRKINQSKGFLGHWLRIISDLREGIETRWKDSTWKIRHHTRVFASATLPRTYVSYSQSSGSRKR